MKTILVTGIGGNVGQGVLRNLQRLDSSIRIIGTNTTLICSGNSLCDASYQVPFAYDDAYLPAILKICTQESVDLVIPTTDYESYYLADLPSEFPPVATHPKESSKIFLDKYFTFEHFVKHNIPFASSWLPSSVLQSGRPLIAKPREGRGSRGIVRNPTNPSAFSDAEYVFQELLEGTEITTAFYVTRNGKLLGHITMERELQNGATGMCSVRKDFDQTLEVMLMRLTASLPLQGAGNIQSIVNADGSIIPFEVNGRISGTNSIRSHFGFDDVRYILDEYLFHKEPEPPTITLGSAQRMLLDIILPEQVDFKTPPNRRTKQYIA